MLALLLPFPLLVAATASHGRHAMPTAAAARAPVLEGAPNFRDLGGHVTRDGRRVRTGLLFRSDGLARLTDADLSRLSATGIATVVDLRTPEERGREPDRLPADTRVLAYDMAAGQDPAPFLRAVEQGRARWAMVALYRGLPGSAAASAALGRLIRIAAATNAPLLFHCTAGKDRTGWASAVMLDLLGVPRAAIFADYLASNTLLARGNAAVLAQARPPLTAERLRPVLSVDRAFLAAAFAAAERRHGLIQRYARDALGLAAAVLAGLRRRYLTAAPVQAERGTVGNSR